MKRLLSTVAAALVCVPSVQAQTTLTSSTPVIGFYKFDVPVGTSAWTCGLVTKKQFQGAMSATAPGTTKSTISISSAGWSPGAFNLHYVEILSGPQEGLIIDIDPTTPNTANQLTVIGKTTGAGSLGLTGTETFCIRRHATLGTVFKNGAGLAEFDDIVTLLDENGVGKPYGFDGANWVDGASFETSYNDKIIYPGQGFLVTASSSRSITIGGDLVAYVRSGPLKIPVYKNKKNLIGIVSPVVSKTTLVPADPDFVSTTTAGGALNFLPYLGEFDRIVSVYSTDGILRTTASFGSDGSTLVDGVTFETNQNATRFRNGGVVVTTPSADVLYTQPSLVP